MARVWNEMTLDAIRRDNPEPTVHARNLYHLSAALWDVWVAYEGVGTPLFVDVDADGSAQDRDQAMSAAAYVLLRERYRNAVGRRETAAELEDVLVALCGDEALEETAEPAPGSPWWIGTDVAQQILAATIDDGALERRRYTDVTYEAVNEPLDVDGPVTPMTDPNRWQPLSLAVAVAQNGVEVPAGPQRYIGPQWGHVVGFALEPDADGLPIDPGPPPEVGTVDFDEGIVAVIAASAELALGEEAIDIGPAGRGDSTLGTDDGAGRASNPVSGEPYEPNVVDRADYARAVAEFWADGPDSETPPGHWNVLANEVSDRLADDGPLVFDGSEVDRVEWDVKLYLALNGALHDAAIAAWGSKRYYDYVRPISIIRHLGAQGRLPEVPDLIETVTEESTRSRHSGMTVGENAVRAWVGPPPEDTASRVLAGVDWIPATEWWPYQRPTFVTPSFPGYVSGHSTFSRAGAEILTAFTGSEYFPDGLHRQPVESFRHELGPSAPFELQWATYYDAADEAGLSRIWGGIHFPVDDYAGRRMGAEVGQLAWARASALFDG